MQINPFIELWKILHNYTLNINIILYEEKRTQLIYIQIYFFPSETILWEFLKTGYQARHTRVTIQPETDMNPTSNEKNIHRPEPNWVLCRVRIKSNYRRDAGS